MPGNWSVRGISRRGKAAAGDDLPEQGRRHVRGYTATPSVAFASEAFISSSEHLSTTAADSTPPTSRLHRPPSAERPPRVAASAPSTEPTAPAGAGPTAADPASSAKRLQRLWDQAYNGRPQTRRACLGRRIRRSCPANYKAALASGCQSHSRTKSPKMTRTYADAR